MGEKSPQRKVMNTSVYASPANTTAPTFTLLVPGLGPSPFPSQGHFLKKSRQPSPVSSFSLKKVCFLSSSCLIPISFFDFILSQCKVNSAVFQYTRKIANKGSLLTRHSALH